MFPGIVLLNNVLIKWPETAVRGSLALPRRRDSGIRAGASGFRYVC
jgi:hypothetical protein